MVRKPFLFVAGAAPLDFLNTEIMCDGAPADLLQNSDDLLLWLAESGLATRADLRTMRATGPHVRESWLKRALRLRAGMRALFLPLAEGQPLRGSGLRPINNVLSSGRGTFQLVNSHLRPQLQFQPHTPDPAFVIARAAAEFLASADLMLVRRCQGEGCILFFYDATKSHTRRWCSMATCGNRTKVRAHYERKHGEE
jgi:predicted RNA-binding Zn ribbon-like protein